MSTKGMNEEVKFVANFKKNKPENRKESDDSMSHKTMSIRDMDDDD